MICRRAISPGHKKHRALRKIQNARCETVEPSGLSGRLLFHTKHFAGHINGCEQQGVRNGCGHGCVRLVRLVMKKLSGQDS